MVQELVDGGTFLLNCPWDMEGLEKHLPGQVKAFIANHNIKFYVIDGIKIGKEIGLGGLSLIHISPVAELEPYVELVDMVLIMSVHPGFGGQSFIPSSLEKIRETRALLDRVNSTACLLYTS